MKLDQGFITRVFTPNVPLERLKDTFVDTGDLSCLKKGNLNLGHGAVFLVVGKRGSGKTTLFKRLFVDMLEALEPRYQNNKIWEKIKLAFPFEMHKKEPSPFLELPLYINVKKTDTSLKETFIREIIKEITKYMLLVNELSGGKDFNGKDELIRILSLVKGIEIKGGEEYGINLGGIWIPLTLKMTKTQTIIERVTELAQYYDLLEEVLQKMNRNAHLNPHFIIFLDEFDKLAPEQANSLLRDHQNVLFESFRKYCSFLLPCDMGLEKEYNGQEHAGIFNAPHFKIKSFSEEDAKRLIDNRLKSEKSSMGSQDVIMPASLKRIVRHAEGIPRIILEKLRDEILENDCDIPI